MSESPRAASYVRVTVIGSGDAFNSAGRAHSAYWVDSPTGAFMVDFGPTALAECKRRGRDPHTLDAVIITHLHGDHVGGLPVLLIDQQYRARRTRPLTVAGPPGTASRLAILMRGAYPDVFARGLSFPVPVVEYTIPGPTTVLGLTVTAIFAAHDPDHFACSLRVSVGGRTLAFSGDTGWQPALFELAAGADLFLCECTDLVTGYPSHLSLPVHERERAGLQVGRLVLTHLGEEMRAAAPELRTRGWELAEDGDVYEV